MNGAGVSEIFMRPQYQSEDNVESFFDLIGEHPDHDKTTHSNSTELDRSVNAWLPSDQTRQTLMKCVTSSTGTFTIDEDLLTTPTIALEENLIDNVKAAITVCFGEAEASQRSALTANDVSQDVQGLRELVEAGSFRAAINLTTKLLTDCCQNKTKLNDYHVVHTPYSLQLWFTRILLLVKIKAYNMAQSEATPFGQLDKPDMFFQFYPEQYKGRPGSMAPFAFRILLAELPMYWNKSYEAISNLYKMNTTVKKILQNLNAGQSEDGTQLELTQIDRQHSIKLWYRRETQIFFSLVHCAISMCNFELAIQIITQLCDRDFVSKPNLFSAIGRLYLQIGNLQTANEYFQRSKQHRSSNTVSTDLRELTDQGLLALANNNFEQAYDYFQKGNALEPSNVMVINNMAVALLYGGNLRKAIEVLESCVMSNRLNVLHESLLLNLCTLYDMITSNGKVKRHSLLKQLLSCQADAATSLLEKLQS